MSSSFTTRSLRSPHLKSILRTRRPITSTQIHPLPRNLTDRIPPEIFELIIQHLYLLGSVHLPTCSLVSKSWLNASRHRFLASVVVDRRRLVELMAILKSPVSTLKTFLHHITLNNNSGSTLNTRVTQEDLSSQRITDYIPVLMGHLTTFTALTSIRLSWMDAELTDYFLRSIVLARWFIALRELEFSSCSFVNLHTFVRAICALQDLQRLTLVDSDWYESGMPEHDDIPISLPPRLEQLELHVTDLSDFCLWLAAHSHDPHSISSVEFCSVLWEEADCTAIGNLLRRLGRKLKHLSLPWHLPEVDLSHLTGLESLELTRLRHFPEVLNNWSITGDDVERTLSQLNSDHLHSVIFRVLVPNGVDPFSLILDWACIAQLLARPTNDNLELISLSGLPSEYDRKFAALLKSRDMERQMEFYDLRPSVSYTADRSRRRSYFERAQVDELSFVGSD